MRITLPILWLLLLASPSAAQRTNKKPTNGPLPRTEIAQRAYASTVVLYGLNAEGKIVSRGTGFYVAPYRIATCRHVIDEASSIAAKGILQDDEEPYLVELTCYFDVADVALLRSNERGTPLPLFRGDDLEVGETVYVMGNPRGLEGTFSEGMISAFRNIDEILHIQITAPVSPGNSGGPLINRRGEVIGIVDQQVGSGQNLNFAIIGDCLSELITCGEPSRQPIELDAYLPKPSRDEKSPSTRRKAGQNFDDLVPPPPDERPPANRGTAFSRPPSGTADTPEHTRPRRVQNP